MVVSIACAPDSDSKGDKLTGSAKISPLYYKFDYRPRPLALGIAASLSDSDRIRKSHIISLSNTVINVKNLHL